MPHNYDVTVYGTWHSSLHGWSIYRPGYGSKWWTADRVGELTLKADTLDGLRSLIRDHPNHDR
jgi:hypothetical protein